MMDVCAVHSLGFAFFFFVDYPPFTLGVVFDKTCRAD